MSSERGDAIDAVGAPAPFAAKSASEPGEGTRYGALDPAPTTHYDVVLETGLLRLRRYSPAVPRRGPPVLLVYSLFKRPFVLDLLPDRSVVQSFLRQGLAVYLTDWLPPSPEHAEIGLYDYVERDLVDAVECVRRLEHVDQVALVGCCLGGFVAAVYAALYPQRVERLVVFALPFHSRPFPLAAAGYFAGIFGNVPAWWIAAGLNAPVANPRSLPAYLAAELGEPELADTSGGREAAALRRAFTKWLESDVPFAGRLFLDVMGDAYARGQFVTDRLMVGGRRVVLEEIRCPVLNVCAERDRLVPAEESVEFVRRVGSRQADNLVFDCGHLGLILSRAAHEHLWPHVGRWLTGDAQAAQSAPDATCAPAADRQPAASDLAPAPAPAPAVERVAVEPSENADGLVVQKVLTAEDRSLPIFAESDRLAERIRLEAYNLFASRGAGEGHALDDWLAAERNVCSSPAKLTEREGEYVLRVALVGFKPAEVSVTATPREIIVKAAHGQERASGEQRARDHVPEFRGDDVLRRVELPAAVDLSKIGANLRNGVLTIVATRARHAPVAATGAVTSAR